MCFYLNKISMQNFSSLVNVFKSKQWNLNDKEETGLFNRISRLLRSLNDSQQRCFIKLLELFDYYTVGDYEVMLTQVLKKMKNELKCNKYVFVPIISERDNRDIKSSMLVTYLLKSNTIQFDNELSKMKKTLQLDLDKSQIKNINNREIYLVLVDDFIGSGNSAIDTANYFVKEGIKKEKIVVLSLVTMKKGIESIMQSDFKFYYSILSLSLSERIEESELDEIKGNIISISEKMKIPSDGCWGFDDSEALLSMIRIPNNTLSLLWKGEPKENVPFPRC